MHLWHFCLGIFLYIATSPGSGKTVLSTAVLDELELRRSKDPIDPYVPSNTLFTYDPADILKWNCSEPSASRGDMTAASEVQGVRASAEPPTGVGADGEKPETKEKILCVDPFKHHRSNNFMKRLSEIFGNCKATTEAPTLSEVQDQFTNNSFIAVYTNVLRSTGLLNDTQFNLTKEESKDNAQDQTMANTEAINTTIKENCDGPKQSQGKAENAEDKPARTFSAYPSTILLVGVENGITILDLTNTARSKALNLTDLKAYSIDYHFNKKRMFFTAKAIIRSTTHNVTTERVDGPVRLTVDWVHDKIYWMADKYRAVEMAELDGSNRTMITNSYNFTYPNNIAVDPADGLLFFVANQSIVRTSLDGSNQTLLHLQGSQRSVDCITVDFVEKRILLAGRNNGTFYIASCDYQGQNLKDIPSLTGVPSRVFAMSLSQQILYLLYRGAEDQPGSVWRVCLSQPPPLTPEPVYSSTASRGKILSLKAYQEE